MALPYIESLLGAFLYVDGIEELKVLVEAHLRILYTQNTL